MGGKKISSLLSKSTLSPIFKTVVHEQVPGFGGWGKQYFASETNTFFDSPPSVQVGGQNKYKTNGGRDGFKIISVFFIHVS